ncbi:MAG: hypothetical protein NVS3B17_07150 [Vulcanimicrobiaceae bacterium]
MTSRHRLRASALGAVLILTAARSPIDAQTIAAVGEPAPDLGVNTTVGRLPSGGTIIVHPGQGAPVAAIELWYRAPSTGFSEKPTPGIARLAAQSVAGAKPIVGDALGKIVSDTGGRLSITTYSDSIAITAVVPATAARKVVKAMTTAYFAPVTSEDAYRSAQRQVAQEALISTFDAEAVVRDAIFAELFTSGPQHYPSLGDPKGASAISFADMKAFAERAFRSQNATLVVSGNVDATVTSAAVAGRSIPDDRAEAPVAPVLATSISPVKKTFVQPSGGYGWVGPTIADQREATAMDFIADYLFRADEGLVVRRALEAAPDSLLVGQFITLRNPGVMFVAYSGKNAVALKSLVDEGLAAVRKPIAAPAFGAALESFKYHLLSDLQTPVQKADNFGWYSVEGSVAYAPGVNGERGAYFRAASSLTPEFVAATVQKYLGKPPVVVTLMPEEKTASNASKVKP